MRRALVVDSHTETVNLLRLALSMHGFVIDVAAAADEGIKKFDDAYYDLVITEVNLPKGSEYVVCEYIRKSDRPDTPVIALSATPLDTSATHFDKLILKPLSLQTLIDYVRHLSPTSKRFNPLGLYVLKVSKRQAGVF